MHRHIARADLVDRLLNELGQDWAQGSEEDLHLRAFAQVILRRVDDRYLYRHRLTTLGSQLIDSYGWVTERLASSDIEVRVFQPKADPNGYELEGTVIETVMPDQPFIYDTLKLFMKSEGLRVHNTLNVIFPALVSEAGKVEQINTACDGARNYSYTRWYCDLPQGMSHAALSAAIYERLEKSRAMVRDFHLMVRCIKDLANEFDYLAKVDPKHLEACHEVRDFLGWLAHESFVFMGVSFYTRHADGSVKVDPSRGLGTRRNDAEPSGAATSRTLELFAQCDAITWPIASVRKSPENSVVHRPGKVDEVLIRTFDAQGKANGGVAIHGLFTFKALSRSGSEIPILRRRIESVVKKTETVPGSYEHKSLLNAFNALPVEYLFEAEDKMVEDLLQLSVKVDETREIQSQVVLHEETSSAYAFIVLPKEYYSDELRAELQHLLNDSLKASYVDHRLYFGKFGTVTLHFYLTGGSSFGCDALSELEHQLVSHATPWVVRLREKLSEDYGDSRGSKLFDEYSEAFHEAYTDMTSAAEAVVDILHLDAVRGSGRLRFDLFPARNEHEAILRIYSNKELLLTDILPVIDNFGVVGAEQVAWEVHPKDSAALYVNTLRIHRGDDDVLEQRASLIDGLRAVFSGRMASTRLNRLLLKAQLTWKQVDLVRAYYDYSAQLGSLVPAELLQRVLMTHADYVSKVVQLFEKRFAPDDGRRELWEQRSDRDVQELMSYLDDIKSFEEDRILRRLVMLILATVRTNFYVEREDGEHFISIKFLSAEVPDMPDPKPLFEIYVHHNHLAGVHLRGGRVARGGLRWSDRADDFRSEILGLMNTQMLKNTLIVPVGAKGGFVLRERFSDYREARERADALYRIFIRGLLELTDNIKDGDVIPPVQVVRYDGDDPYLVVAADKGTAHLSDTANAISHERGFWLGDAFASGGSVGYDHKQYGITARGAWVCVRRHFAELGVDPETDPIRAVGIGDMSGDVFGNGMLLSRSMKVLAAFNHRHIFIDPDPDPETSWMERQRLFQTPGSQWTDYNADVMSAGGGIYERGAKAIHLSEQAREALGAKDEEVSGSKLIQLILMAEVDLLWNGGIGTYVKSSSESHSDVEDKDNDSVRIDASQLRCKVIGEGGNLGLTMKARVEFAHLGGYSNLDAIDNSGGVDLSDHEVNLKACLQPVVHGKALSPEDRNELLMQLAEDQCDRVLANSGGQSLALSLDTVRSQKNIWAVARAMKFLRSEIGFSRRVECLPRGRDFLEHRVARRQGFMRPELAKLLSFSKMYAYRALKEHPIGTQDELVPYLMEYFPAVIGERFLDAIKNHMLFHEIAATVQVNRIVDMAGVTFFPSQVSATKRSASEVATAYLLSDEVLGLEALRAPLRGLGQADEMVTNYQALIEVETALAQAVTTVLGLHRDELTLSSTSLLNSASDAVAGLRGKIHTILSPDARATRKRAIQTWHERGLKRATAESLVDLQELSHAFVIGDIAARTDRDVMQVASIFLNLGHLTHVFALMEATHKQVYRDDWDQLAIDSIRQMLLTTVIDLTEVFSQRLTTPSAKEVKKMLNGFKTFEAIGADISEILYERIPVSATFVLADRLRQWGRQVKNQSK